MSPPVLLPPLKDLCIKVVSGNFEQRPTFGKLSEDNAKHVTDGLALDLPLELVGTLIADEDYWSRRACKRWKNCQVQGHGQSWKQLYFERNLQDVLEQLDPATADMVAVRRLMAYSRRFVKALTLQQLPSHLDLQVIFEVMVNCPASLTLTYGLQHIGMDYDRSMFGMKLSDCRALARALAHTEVLVHLDLSGNCLDDDKVRMLASGLADNISITHLCLAHNKIADRGVRALAKLLDASSCLAILNLSDNQLHAEGGRALGRALRSSKSLMSLNLRLNRLGDDGCRAVCDALQAGACAPLERLSLAGNNAGHGAVVSIAGALRNSRTLIELDVSCNSFGAASGPELLSALQEGASGALAALDVRSCGLSSDDEEAVAEELLARRERKDRGRVLEQGGAAKISAARQ